MNHTIETNCPECNVNHEIVFIFYAPVDGDIHSIKVVCECDCEFEIEADIIVEIDFNISNPVITKSALHDPNQSKLF